MVVLKLLSVFALIALSGCTASIYEASFIAAVASKSPARPEGAIYDPPDFATFAAVLRSPHFWSKYVKPRLASGIDAERSRRAFSVSPGKIAIVGNHLTFEFCVRLTFGGEPIFDAVRDGFGRNL
jgi:hypothetical protein